MKAATVTVLGAALLASAPVQAVQVASGTGFFISKSGYILTNQHVVAGCDEVSIRGAVKPSQARVVKTDDEVDLALLKTKTIPPRVAHLRENNGYPIQAGDAVMVIGYPGRHGMTGQYKRVHSKVIDVTGPLGGDRWIQFEDSAQQGNSGGPLLDESGNVVGVIVGKTQTIRTNNRNGQQEVVGRSDVAINLSYVWDFLAGEGIQTKTMTSALQLNNGYLERMAKDSLVNIHCER